MTMAHSNSLMLGLCFSRYKAIDKYDAFKSS